MVSGLVRFSRHGRVAFFLSIEPDNLSDKGCFSGRATGAAFGHDDAPFIKGGRVDGGQSENFGGHAAGPEYGLAAFAAFNEE